MRDGWIATFTVFQDGESKAPRSHGKKATEPDLKPRSSTQSSVYLLPQAAPFIRLMSPCYLCFPTALRLAIGSVKLVSVPATFLLIKERSPQHGWAAVSGLQSAVPLTQAAANPASQQVQSVHEKFTEEHLWRSAHISLVRALVGHFKVLRNFAESLCSPHTPTPNPEALEEGVSRMES